MDRERDPPRPQGLEGDTDDQPVRPIHKALKRIRQSLGFSRSIKAAKRFHVPAQGHVKENTHLQSLTADSERPLAGQPFTDLCPSSLEPTPQPSDPRGFLTRESSPSTTLPGPASSLGTPLAQTFQLSERPGVPPVTASEDNLMTRAAPSVVSRIHHSSSTRSLPTTSTILPSRPSLRTTRAETLFGKYGVSLEPESYFYLDKERQRGEAGERVHKSIRVRIHHHCHRCDLTIGKNGVCVSCGHQRCRKCSQWPDTRRRVRIGARSSCGTSTKGKEILVQPPVPSTRSEPIENWTTGGRRPSLTSMRTWSTSSKSSQAHYVQTVRNVRRYCHRCHAPYIWTETCCQDCDHEMCDDCPQDPPPEITSACSHAAGEGHHRDGGQEERGGCWEPRHRKSTDRVLKKPRIRVKYKCEQCATLFGEGERICAACGHQRCHKCSRSPPRSAPQPLPSIETLMSLNRRLASFS